MEATENNNQGPDGVDMASGKDARERAEAQAGSGSAGVNETAGAGPESGAAESNAANAPDGPEATGSEQAPAPEETVDPLEQARREIEELKDAWNRERADFVNFRKRTMQEKGQLRTEAVATFSTELISVLDDFDRVLSLQPANDEVKNFLTGVDMIRQSFLSILSRNKIQTASPLNEAFDPTSMEGIATEEREGLERDTVVEVYQAGLYMELDDGERRTLRAARVKVGKAPAGAPAGVEPTEGETSGES